MAMKLLLLIMNGWIDDSPAKAPEGAQINVINHRFFTSRHFM